jgi:protein-tyrosine kinase
MDHIRQAIDRAKKSGSAETQPKTQFAPPFPQLQVQQNEGVNAVPLSWGREVALNGKQLEPKRIIAHNIADPRSKSFDMLRTQVLQAMQTNSWQIVGVTSPTAGCGKTVVAINLALSLARLQDRSVLLVDLDLQKPRIAYNLGLTCDRGMVSLLEGRTDLPSAMIQARINNQRFSLLPCEAATPDSSEWMASKTMSAFLQVIKQEFKGWIVIFDLPPLLIGDDVITLLPEIDCTLFVAAVGISTMSEIKECKKHLDATSLVRVVLNKSSEMHNAYYSRYAEVYNSKR